MPRPPSPEEAALVTISNEIDQVVDVLAARMGPAVGSRPISEDTLLRQWGTRDPKVMDPEGLKQQLMATGLPPEMLDPNSPNALAIVKANPEMAQVLAQPLDEKMADLVTSQVEYPLRIPLLKPYVSDPKEYVALANRLNARWQKSGSSPEPEPKPDTLTAPPDSLSAPAPPPAAPPIPPAQAVGGAPPVVSTGGAPVPPPPMPGQAPPAMPAMPPAMGA